MLEKEHAFIIGDYRKSLYLDECLKTIMKQNVK